MKNLIDENSKLMKIGEHWRTLVNIDEQLMKIYGNWWKLLASKTEENLRKLVDSKKEFVKFACFSKELTEIVEHSVKY